MWCTYPGRFFHWHWDNGMMAALIEFHESIRKKVLGKVNWYQHTKKCITLYGLIEHVASAKTGNGTMQWMPSSYGCLCTSTSWWRHKMEAFSALLALCVGNPAATHGFPSHRPVKRSFDVLFELRLNKRLSKNSWRRWFETSSRPLWRHCNGNPRCQMYDDRSTQMDFWIIW